MATCRQLIGHWTRLPCGGVIVNSRCQRCGAVAGDQGSTGDGGSAGSIEFSFSDEELERFGVILSSAQGDANPPEWGNDPFTDFT